MTINLISPTDRFQFRVYNWLIRCFGQSTADDKNERTKRFCEEALELVQAAGGSKEMVFKMVDYVYSRDVGELAQEIGGASTTMAALAQAFGIDSDAARETELARAETKIPEIQEKWKNKPKFDDEIKDNSLD